MPTEGSLRGASVAVATSTPPALLSIVHLIEAGGQRMSVDTVLLLVEHLHANRGMFELS